MIYLFVSSQLYLFSFCQSDSVSDGSLITGCWEINFTSFGESTADRSYTGWVFLTSFIIWVIQAVLIL